MVIRSPAALSRFTWRLGRKLYLWGRGEVANEPRHNGEYWLLEEMVRAAPHHVLVLFDVGCNRGNWSAHAFEAALRHNKRPTIHAFEPEPSALHGLADRFRDTPSVRLNHSAVAEKSGSMDFYVIGAAAGTNSLSKVPGAVPVTVPVTTIDDYCDGHGISFIDFLKCDVEGFDSHVIQGAKSLLSAGGVGVLQFEYNWRWILARRFLRDVFELCRGTQYMIGRLGPGRIDVFDEWHFELERFFEGNYVLIRRGVQIPGARLVTFDSTNSFMPNE